MSWNGGDYPLNHTVFAGELLYTDSDYIMSLKTPEQVRDIAAALSGITEADFRRRYDAIDPKSYGLPLTDEDFRYTWDWFQGVSDLYTRAAEAGRFVFLQPTNENGQQDHWSERGRPPSLSNSDATGCPRRSALR